MKQQTKSALALASAALIAILAWGYFHWHDSSSDREELLSLMPSDASTVVFADLQNLRSSPFLAALYAWAPRPAVDPEYAEFVRSTGFNYERDLDRVAIAISTSAQQTSFSGIAEGHFDKDKISAYVLRSGTRSSANGHEFFLLPANGGARALSIVFLSDNRVAFSNETALPKTFFGGARNSTATDWQVRFERLAGSPIFAVFQQQEQQQGSPHQATQDAGALAGLADRAPGGFRSPQLSALLDRLQWITLAGKPDGDRLNVVMECESVSEETPRQLSDLLNGILVLAQAGLNDAKTRQQLDPALRSAYLELIRGADVSQIDRGDTKAVRVVFGVTPQLLEAAREASASLPPPAPTAAPKVPHAAKSKR